MIRFPRLVALVLALPVLACGSGSGEGGSPTEELTGRLLGAESSARQIASALETCLVGSFDVKEQTSTNAFARSFTVRRKDASTGPFVVRELVGTATTEERKGWTIARLTLRPPRMADASPTHDQLGATIQDAFPLLPGPEGRPVVPYAPEVWARLTHGRVDLDAAGGWAAKAIQEGARHTLLLHTPVDLPSQNAGGFLLVALRAPAADGPALADLSRDLSAYVRSLGPSRPDPKGTPSWRLSRQALRTRDPIIFGLSLREGLASLPSAPRVSGLDGRLVTVLRGPGIDEVSAFLEVDDVLLRATLKKKDPSGDAELVQTLPRLGRLAENPSLSPPGKLIWSGRLQGEEWDPYLGKVYSLGDLALDWRPLAATSGRMRG